MQSAVHSHFYLAEATVVHTRKKKKVGGDMTNDITYNFLQFGIWQTHNSDCQCSFILATGSSGNVLPI